MYKPNKHNATQDRNTLRTETTSENMKFSLISLKSPVLSVLRNSLHVPSDRQKPKETLPYDQRRESPLKLTRTHSICMHASACISKTGQHIGLSPHGLVMWFVARLQECLKIPSARKNAHII